MAGLSARASRAPASQSNCGFAELPGRGVRLLERIEQEPVGLLRRYDGHLAIAPRRRLGLRKRSAEILAVVMVAQGDVHGDSRGTDRSDQFPENRIVCRAAVVAGGVAGMDHAGRAGVQREDFLDGLGEVRGRVRTAAHGVPPLANVRVGQQDPAVGVDGPLARQEPRGSSRRLPAASDPARNWRREIGGR